MATPGHHLGEARTVGAEMLGADRRADAVGADDHIGFGCRAIGEARRRRAVRRFGADAVGAETERRVAGGPAQEVMQIGAVGRHIGRAILFARHRFERLAKAKPPFIPGHRHNAQRLEGVAHELVFKTERAQHLDAVRSDLQSGADFFELADALVDLDFDPALAQRNRRRQPADAGADNGDAKGPFCWVLRHCRSFVQTPYIRGGTRNAMVERRIETTIDVNAPVARVWAVLTDFSRMPSWNPFIKSISGSLAPGTRLSVYIAPPGKSGMRFKPTVLSVRPERELRWLGHLLVSGIFDGEHYFLLEPIGEDRTRLTQGEKFSGLLVGLVSGTLSATEAGFRAMNEALRQEAERH